MSSVDVCLLFEEISVNKSNNDDAVLRPGCVVVEDEEDEGVGNVDNDPPTRTFPATFKSP